MKVRYAPEHQSDRSELKGAAIGIIDLDVGSNVVVSGPHIEGEVVGGWEKSKPNDLVVAFIDARDKMVLTIMDEKRFFEAIDSPRDKAANVASIPLDARTGSNVE